MLLARAASRLLVVLIAAGVCAAHITPEGWVRGEELHGVTEYRHRKGLRVLLIPDQSRDTITVNITYAVGSRHEKHGEAGLAHLLEHLLFERTGTHSDLYRELAARGGYANGETGLDGTAYYVTVAASAENLEWALDLEASRMTGAIFSPERLQRAIAVVRSEAAIGENNVEEALTERLFSAAYTWHNYRRPVIGSVSGLSNITLEQVREFYATYYRPANAILVVSGRFAPADALASIGRAFGPLSTPEAPLPKTCHAEPPQDGPRQIELRRAGNLHHIYLGYHIPSMLHPDFAPLQLLSRVLGQTPSGRLHRGLVDQNLASGVFGYSAAMADPGLAVFGARIRDAGSVDDARRTMLAIVEQSATERFSRQELERARAAAVGRIDALLRSSERLALEIGDWAAAGDWRLLFVHRARLERVAPDDLNRVAAHYFKPPNRTLARFVPEASPESVAIPQAPSLAEVLAEPVSRPAPLAAGEAFDAEPANVESAAIRGALPSGLKLVLLPKETRGGTVHVRLNLRFGDLSSLKDYYWPGHLAARMLARGTRQHSRQDIQDALLQAQASLGISGAADRVTATLSTTSPHLHRMLRLLAEMLRQPRFSPREFGLLKEATIAGLGSELSDPESVASTALFGGLYPYPASGERPFHSVRDKLTALAQTTLDDVERFHRSFYGASVGELVLVGDFDPRDIERLAHQEFGAWPSPGGSRPSPRPYAEGKPIQRQIEVPDRPNSVLLAAAPLNLTEDSPDYPAVLLGVYMLGGGFLNSRLAERIRGQEALSYDVHAYLSGGPLDLVRALVISAQCSPGDMERVESAVRDELRRVRRDGFTPEEVDQAIQGWLQQERLARRRDAELARQLALDASAGRTQEWTSRLWRRIRALTPEEVNRAMREQVRAGSMSVVKAGDFGGVDPPPVSGSQSAAATRPQLAL